MTNAVREPDPYRAFLETKVKLATTSGADVPLDDINPAMRPVARLMCRWLLRQGRGALFASFGLHKTTVQLEAVRIAAGREAARGRVGRGLIVAPLGVRDEFRKDAVNWLAWEAGPVVVRSSAEVGGAGVYWTHYEAVREGKVDPALFDAVSLDEADVLRTFGSKTYQTFLPLFEAVPWRFVATATPSPNRYKELIHYAGYLGVMDTGQALTRFFQRNSEKAGDLTLYPHKEDEFWLWVASWALFVSRPSDLGLADDGYDLPALDVRWHEVPVDHGSAGADGYGQGLLFREAGLGVTGASREKRETLPARAVKAAALRRERPGEHVVLWHDLEDERAALEQMLPQVVSVFGKQALEAREEAIALFSDGWVSDLAAKPVLAGAGCNLQRHCAWAIFLGVGFKFRDFIQAIHRLQRFGQGRPVRIDVIYAESERGVRRELIRKWKDHERLTAKMREIVKTYGLSNLDMAEQLKRSIGAERVEASGVGWTAINNDCVVECRRMGENSVDEIVTSIPFSNQYEYTPSYNDFGHTESNAEFWAQMGYLIPQLYRILKPGRIAAIHVKDRLLPGSKTGSGCYTVEPFHMETYAAFVKAGFLYMGMRVIQTDVVRENNQSYRLSYGEMLEDATKMGSGSQEFVLQFRKPQSDLSKQYADVRVRHERPEVIDAEGRRVKWDRKHKDWRPVAGDGYSLARWQLDASGLWRSSGDRLLGPLDLAAMEIEDAMRVFREQWLACVYDHEVNVAIGEAVAARGKLPMKFAAFDPPSWSAGIWTDVARMLTLNGAQSMAGREMHVCPLQLDVVERLIRLFSNPGEVVFDPFGGIGTVPYVALGMGRRGLSTELNPQYWADGVRYLTARENALSTPTLFDAMAVAEAAA